MSLSDRKRFKFHFAPQKFSLFYFPVRNENSRDPLTPTTFIIYDDDKNYCTAAKKFFFSLGNNFISILEKKEKKLKGSDVIGNTETNFGMLMRDEISGKTVGFKVGIICMIFGIKQI